MQSELDDLYQTLDSNIPILLPSMHSTSCLNCEDILKNRELSPKYCHVFDTDLLYFFYGKPSYKVSSKIHNSQANSFESPCCFIVKTEEIKIKRIFPFDTGAYAAKKYTDYIRDDLSIDQFVISDSVFDIPKFIKLFFETNDNYLHGVSRVQLDHCTQIVRMLLGLLQANGNINFDNRSRTIEIISDRTVLLAKSLIALIVPDSFLRNTILETFLKYNHKVEVISYYADYPKDPIEQNEAVFQMAMKYIEEKYKLK